MSADVEAAYGAELARMVPTWKHGPLDIDPFEPEPTPKFKRRPVRRHKGRAGAGRFTEEQRVAIAASLGSLPEVAARFGCDRTYVWRLRRQRGVK